MNKQMMIQRMKYALLFGFCGGLFACVAPADTQDTAEQAQAVADAKDITNAFFNERSANCAVHVAAYKSQAKDINENVVFYGLSNIHVDNGKCVFSANAIPNHDFNDASRGFPNPVSEQNQRYEISANPQKATTATPLTLQYDNAIMLNGVKLDLLAAGCFGVGDGKIGCNDINQAWRYDPMAQNAGFMTDSHNAHAQPDGTYHYHGDPKALYPTDSSKASPVIGFAADGFPIFGPFIEADGNIRRATSSYQLKSGARPTGNGSPGGNYDGTFVDDFEYLAGSGDLDECNGMEKDGIYGYYVTESYPHVMGCFKGTPDASFQKGGGAPVGGPPPRR